MLLRLLRNGNVTMNICTSVFLPWCVELGFLGGDRNLSKWGWRKSFTASAAHLGELFSSLVMQTRRKILKFSWNKACILFSASSGQAHLWEYESCKFTLILLGPYFGGRVSRQNPGFCFAPSVLWQSCFCSCTVNWIQEAEKLYLFFFFQLNPIPSSGSPWSCTKSKCHSWVYRREREWARAKRDWKISAGLKTATSECLRPDRCRLLF